MNSLKFIISILLFLPLYSFSQDCTCEDDFEWVKKTFEENDAGFAYAIENKGQAAYDKHNEEILQKVQATDNSLDCTQTLYEWLTFFRKGHIGIRRVGNQASRGSQEAPSDEDIIQQFASWESLQVDLPEFYQYLETKKEHDYEGVWVSEPYKVGIKKQGDNYRGFIIEADGVYWRPGQIKFKIDKTEDGYKSTFYMRDHSPQ